MPGGQALPTLGSPAAPHRRGTSIDWNGNGPIRNKDWDQKLCFGVGTSGWIWWEPCDGSAAQQWTAVYKSQGTIPPATPPSPPRPPSSPSPPPPPPAKLLPAAPATSPNSSSAVIASPIDVALALRDNSKTEFLISTSFLLLPGSPLFIIRPGGRVRVSGPPCTLWTGTCPRISAANLSAIMTVVSDTLEVANLEFVDGRAVGASSSGGLTGQVRLSVTLTNVGFRNFYTDNVRLAAPGRCDVSQP